MGTVVSFAFDDGEAARIDLERLQGTFAHFDDRYSLYKPDSELSRVARHELDLADASDELRAAYAAAGGQQRTGSSRHTARTASSTCPASSKRSRSSVRAMSCSTVVR